MDHQYMRSLCEDNNETETETEYNPDHDELLIELVKGHPHLYDKKHRGFKDINLKNASWAEISSATNLPAEYCMNRWSRLRERYAKLSKYNAVAEGAGKKVFPAYDSLHFLSPHIKRRKRFVISSINKPITPKQVVQVAKQQQPVTYYLNCGIPSSTVSNPTVLSQGTKLVIPGNPPNTFLVSNVISNKKQDNNNYATVLPKVEETELLLNRDSDEDSNSGNVITPEVSFEDGNNLSKDCSVKMKRKKIDYFTLFVGEELEKLPEDVRKEKKKKIFAILME